MDTSILTQSKTDDNNRIFQDWIDSTEQAIEALFVWKAYLRAWQTHPNVTDAAFMAAVQSMAEAGIMAWLDRPELDTLRETLTGVEQ